MVCDWFNFMVSIFRDELMKEKKKQLLAHKVIRPNCAQRTFNFDPYQGYSAGYLAVYFFTISVHGLLHIAGASNVNRCLSVAFIFYRIVLSVPVFIILFLVDQIERNLFTVLLSFDLAFSVMIFLSLILEKRNESYSSEEMQTSKDN